MVSPNAKRRRAWKGAPSLTLLGNNGREAVHDLLERPSRQDDVVP
jgi:hypothetical protein